MLGNRSPEHLKQLIERIERLEAEKADIAANITDVYNEAKADGFDAKIMRQIVRLRKKSASERTEEEQVLDFYKHALDMEENTGSRGYNASGDVAGGSSSMGHAIGGGYFTSVLGMHKQY